MEKKKKTTMAGRAEKYKEKDKKNVKRENINY